MKKKFLVISVLLLIAFGCQESNSVLEPTNQENASALSKISSTYTSNTYVIDGSNGGTIKVAHSWKNENGKNSKLKAVLNIPKNAFEGTKEFSMVFNLDKNSVSLYPSPTTFDKPLLFSLKLKNVNVLYDDLDFKYLDGNEEVAYEENIVDTKLGNLEVKKAQIPHFSDWGWSR
ncbi:MAG: hypothetical protein IPH62_13895 [Ignavibacteriae bacterium]|nr:hypothetical protein [Ignavibacteriota bacterium]